MTLSRASFMTTGDVIYIWINWEADREVDFGLQAISKHMSSCSSNECSVAAVVSGFVHAPLTLQSNFLLAQKFTLDFHHTRHPH